MAPERSDPDGRTEDNLYETMHEDLGDELQKWAHKDWSLCITSKTLNITVKVESLDYILGSSEDCDIVVEDRGIAGNHLVFIREEHGIRMINVSGKQNVYINGQPAALKDILSPGDRVTVKTCEIILKEE